MEYCTSPKVGMKGIFTMERDMVKVEFIKMINFKWKETGSMG
jgi:hypothetical protein